MSRANVKVDLAEPRHFAGCCCGGIPKKGRTPEFGFVIEHELGARHQTDNRARVFNTRKPAGNGCGEARSNEAIANHRGPGCHAFKAVVTHDEVPPMPVPITAMEVQRSILDSV